MPGMRELDLLSRLSDFAYRRRRAILVAGGAAFVVAALVASAIFDVVKSFGLQDPGSEGARAYDRYEEATGEAAIPGVVLLVEPGGDVASPRGRSEVGGAADALASLPGIARVQGPSFADGSGISTDRRAAYLLGFLSADVDDPPEIGERALEELGGNPAVSVGGLAVAAHEINEQSEEDLQEAEVYAAPILLLLCFWVFRSVVAALLPILVGAFAIAGTIAVMRGLAGVVDIDVFSINIVTGLGLGLAIDYSLLILARYREELTRAGPGPEALRRTLATAGRTVAFSAVIVAFALAALLIFPQRFLYSTALGGALVVVLSALAALILLPAALAALGPRLNALALPGLRRSQVRGEAARGGWYRLARAVMHRPVPVATATAAVMIAAGIPFLDVELTSADARVLPEERSARRVDDALRARFPVNATTPLVSVVDTQAADRARRPLRPLTQEIRDLPGVERVAGPQEVGGGLKTVAVFGSADPLSDGAEGLLRELRGLEWPHPTLVGGRTADLVDQKESMESHLPLAVAIIAVLTLTALFAMTGSVVIPVVALVMNLLTISAAFGILVFVFQDGRLEGLLDYTSQGALDTSMPILIFAVAFGLSTDYGVFLFNRIKETRDAGGGDADSVAIALERTGRVVTAAALLFSVAVGVFVTSQLVQIKEASLGLVAAVLLDATIVRALLLPSLMRLLGRWAWWAPGSLARLRERLSFSRL